MASVFEELLARVLDDATMAAPAQQAREGGRVLVGEGGLLQLTKRFLEASLEASLEGEPDAHLGYAKHHPTGRKGGNSRNGRRSRTMTTTRSGCRRRQPCWASP
jgi:putative transposase